MKRLIFTLSLLAIITGAAYGEQTKQETELRNDTSKSPLSGMKFAILGDSSTTKNAWPEVFQRDYLPASARVSNQAIGGTAWSTNKYGAGIIQQWEKAKTELESMPDIVIITTGMNNLPDNSLSYDAIMQMCLRTDISEKEGEMQVAILALRKIIDDAPGVELYLVSNFYGGSAPRKNRDRLRYRDQLSALCDFFSCRLIDLTRNSCNGDTRRRTRMNTFSRTMGFIFTRKPEKNGLQGWSSAQWGPTSPIRFIKNDRKN